VRSIRLFHGCCRKRTRPRPRNAGPASPNGKIANRKKRRPSPSSPNASALHPEPNQSIASPDRQSQVNVFWRWIQSPIYDLETAIESTHLEITSATCCSCPRYMWSEWLINSVSTREGPVGCFFIDSFRSASSFSSPTSLKVP